MIAAEKIALLTVTEAAAALGRTRGSVHHHRLTGRLPAIRVGRRFMIPLEDVVALRRERAAVIAAPKTTGS